jgi:hypothetical protein
MMQELANPPRFGPGGTNPPMESSEVLIGEMFFFRPEARFGSLSGTLTRLLDDETNNDPGVADARTWVSDNLPETPASTDESRHEIMPERQLPIVTGTEGQR